MTKKPDRWIRARFHADADDYRPVKWPPPGPYWCTGHGDDYNIVVAFVKTEDQIKEYWPEAEDIDVTQENKITYTERFSKPEWYQIRAEGV